MAGRLNRAGRYAQGYYIIGFPSETLESIAEDLKQLAALELDVTQITIVTPHPRTQLWSELDAKYGILEKDWANFDTKHLVWSHPNCPPGSLEGLLSDGFKRCYGRQWLRRRGTKNSLASRVQQGNLTDLLWSPMPGHGGRRAKRAAYLQPFVRCERC